MGTVRIKTRKERVAIRTNWRGRLNGWIILLMFCLCMFSSDAWALYSIFESDVSDVYGISGSGSLVLDGAEFGSVIVIASNERAYSIYSSGGNITINGLFDSVGIITATVGTNNDAFALYAPSGSIYTNGLDGTINSQAEDSWAVGLYSPNNDVNTGDINGTISAQAGNNWAVGILGDSIYTGDIDGVINSVASNNTAVGLLGGGPATVNIGDINGTIYAEATHGSEAFAIYSDSDLIVGDIGIDANIVAIAETGDAYGMYSGGDGVASLHTGDISGKITADVNDGTGAYAMYSRTDIVVDGNITSTALIGATATGSLVPETAYGMYSDGSIQIGDVNGTIFAEMTDGPEAYAIYAANDITIGSIGSDANIWASAETGDAYGLYSGPGSPSIHIGDIDGKITADVNNGSGAFGMYSYYSITTGNVGSGANISATASDSGAYALYSENGSIDINDIDGEISAQAVNGSVAYAMYSGGSSTIYIDDVNGLITADANNSGAYAMYSNGDIIIGGNITDDGEISATAGESGAYALYSGSGSIYTGDIDGEISAQAINGSGAYAMYSTGGSTIYTGDVNGLITADANASGAYAMYSIGDIIIDGNITSDGEISATAGESGAYALYSDSDSIYTGDIDGEISAQAVNGSGAYAIYSAGGSTIYTGEVNGLITADANTSSAYAMYSNGDIIIDGNITSDAEISATAGQNGAYALYSGSGSVDTGDIDGLISAEALDGSSAYGFYSGGSSTINTGDVNGVISAYASQYGAYGMYSGGNIIIDGDITSDANISATAEEGSAYALCSEGGSVYTGDIDGVITAEALNESTAYAIYSGGVSTIYTGDVNGVISAYADDYNARAMYSVGDIIIDGDITSDANISAIAGEGTAYGLYSADGSISVEDIDGVISAKALMRSVAYGLYSGGGDTIYTEDVNGVITAYADEGSAYGMYSSGDIIIDGDITSNADISATTGSGYGYAYGIFSAGGGGSVHIEDINGVITADSGDSYAYAVYSNSGIWVEDIGVDANISAIADQDYSYALYSSFDDVNTGDIDGTITAIAGSSYATGLRATNGSVYTGDINGTITATAMDNYAYGLYSNDVTSIHVGDVNGTISADVTSGSYAYGMYSASDITIGDILSDGLISASAADSYAYGLFSGGGYSVHIGDIDGTITADAHDYYAYGIYSLTDITVGDIGANALISATAGYDYAYGLYSGGGESIYTGDIDGTIIATSGGDDAAGLYSANSSVTTGDINGMIYASAQGSGNETAYGIFGYDSVTIGDVNGIIAAEMNGVGAYAIRSDTDITTGDITNNAYIVAAAGYGDAYGLYSVGVSSVHTGDVNGVVSAVVNNGDYAAAMYSNSSITTGDFGVDAAVTATTGGSYASGLTAPGVTTGALDGTFTVMADANYATGLSAMGLQTGPIGGIITVVADVNYAYGLSAISMQTGPISGTVSATTGQDYAVGLLASGNLTTSQISGTVDANAVGDFAYGILSYGAMDVNVVGGTVSAVANDGNNVAAIQSGQISGGALVSQDANDTLGIAAGSTIVGDIDLAQNGTDNDVLTLWGVDSNSPGSTTFTDDINNVETINVTGGTFYVNGTVANSTNGITMYDGVLGGSGDILCDLHVMGGVFAPGNSIDTVHIGGDWTHDPNGIFEVEVDNNELGDLVIVDGNTVLDGTIRGKVFGDRIDHTFSSPVLVIDSNELSGVFADVNGATIFPIFSVSYDTDNNDVYLGVLFDYAYYARTNNQRAVGRAFNQIVSGGRDTGDMNDVLTAIENLPDGEAVNEAYNQLMPQDMLGLPDVTRRIMNTHNDGIMEQMDNRRRAGQYTMLENNRYLLANAGNSMALLSETGEWMPFVKGIGMWADRDSERDIAGYKYKVYGAIAGMDKQVSDNSILGFGIGGLRTKVDYTRGSTKADIDSILMSLHGSYFTDDWHLDYTAGYGHSWYDQQRGITFLNRIAKSDHKSDAFTFEVEYGQNLGGSNSILEPVAGMGYTLVREGGYTESDAGAANLKVDSENYDGFYTKLGIQTTTEVTFESNPDLVMVPKLSAFWVHDFADRVEVSSSFVGGGSFTTEGLDPVRDMFNIGAGLNTYINNNTRIFVDYVWQFSSDFESHMLQAGIQWPF